MEYQFLVFVFSADQDNSCREGKGRAGVGEGRIEDGFPFEQGSRGEVLPFSQEPQILGPLVGAFSPTDAHLFRSTFKAGETWHEISNFHVAAPAPQPARWGESEVFLIHRDHSLNLRISSHVPVAI